LAEIGGIAAVSLDPSVKAGLDHWCVAVPALSLGVLEQPFDECADLAVVGEHEVADAFDALSVIAEDVLGSVNHPLLGDGVGEHPLGERAEPDEVVAERLSDCVSFLLAELGLGAVVERAGVVAGDRGIDDFLGALAAVLGGEVDLLAGKGALDRLAECLGGVARGLGDC
jgi:hypothetical protein